MERPATRHFPLQEQDSSIVSMITNNQGHFQPQHSMQAQLHTPLQPGHQIMATQQQLQALYQQQQLRQAQAHFAHEQSMAQDATRAQALMDLNQHMDVFVQKFGPVQHGNAVVQPQPQMAPHFTGPSSAPQSVHFNGSPSAPQPTQFNGPPSAPQSAMVTQRPFTPTNSFTPAHPASAPPRRAERVLLDVAPMANFAVPMLQVQGNNPASAQIMQDSFGSEYAYPSPYPSSAVDPSSPSRSSIRNTSTAGLPTLYEHISPASSQGAFGHEQFFSAASSSPELRYISESPMRIPMSPREMMLANLDIDASIEETGISAEDVQQYISEQSPIDGKWTCLYDECHKTFGRKENIKSHVQTHLGDRQFKCNHCGKCFVRHHDLKRHAKIHSGDKPCKCPCGHGFARQDALTRHRQRGVCIGALPGCEKEPVKRGRPRKARPDMEARMDKASRAREMDARRGSDESIYASSSPSDSYPETPPGGDFEEDPFSANFSSFLRPTYEVTPPTSPLHSSPAKSTYMPMSEVGEFLQLHFQLQTTEQQQLDSPPHSSPPHLSHELSPYLSPAEINSSPVLGAQNSSNVFTESDVSPAEVDNSPVLGGHSSGDVFTTSVFDFGPPESQPKVCEPIDAFSPAASSYLSDFDHQSPENHVGAETFMGADAMLEFTNGIYGSDDHLYQTVNTSFDWPN